MGDQWTNDQLLVCVEKDIFDIIENETIMQHFQYMKTRRGQLQYVFYCNIINKYDFFFFICSSLNTILFTIIDCSPLR